MDTFFSWIEAQSKQKTNLLYFLLNLIEDRSKYHFHHHVHWEKGIKIYSEMKMVPVSIPYLILEKIFTKCPVGRISGLNSEFYNGKK